MSTPAVSPPPVIGSPPGSLSAYDLKRTGTLLAIVMISSGLTFASEWASGQDLGISKPFVMALIGGGIELFRRLKTNTQAIQVPQEAAPLA